MNDVLIHEADGVLELRLNRPGKKNALTGAMYDAMSDALDRAETADSVRAVLFSGEGDGYCAGNDINDFLHHGSGDGHAPRPSGRFIGMLPRFGKPMVAAVQGAAVGIGTTMLLHCDLVYAAPDARLSTPFVRLGLVPEAGSSLLLPRRIGAARAAAMLLLAEPMPADQALAAGLVNELVEPGALREHARAKARALAALPRQALLASRALMRGDGEALEAQMQRELEAFGQALRSPAAKAAFAAFLERRPG